MTTAHFNQLTEAEQERLVILAEECSEVGKACNHLIQIVCKILRHGYGSTDHGKMLNDNRALLEEEIGHVFHAVSRLTESADVDPMRVAHHESKKAEKIGPYLHHQGGDV